MSNAEAPPSPGPDDPTAAAEPAAEPAAESVDSAGQPAPTGVEPVAVAAPTDAEHPTGADTLGNTTKTAHDAATAPDAVGGFVSNGYSPHDAFAPPNGYEPDGRSATGGYLAQDPFAAPDAFAAPDGYDPDDESPWADHSAAEADSADELAADGADFEWVDPGGAASRQSAGDVLFAGGDEPEARPRRHIGRYVALAGAALVLGAAVVTGPTLWRVYSARHIKLTLPTSIAGLSRDSTGDSQDTADYLRDAVGTSTSLSNPLGAVYDAGGDAAHSVLVFGGTGAIFRPSHTLGSVLGLLDDSSDAITGLHTVAAGPLGGTMKCGMSIGSGDGTSDPLDPDMPICGWADHGSSVAALFPGRTVEQAADLMLQFRAAIEKK